MRPQHSHNQSRNSLISSHLSMTLPMVCQQSYSTGCKPSCLADYNLDDCNLLTLKRVGKLQVDPKSAAKVLILLERLLHCLLVCFKVQFKLMIMTCVVCCTSGVGCLKECVLPVEWAQWGGSCHSFSVWWRCQRGVSSCLLLSSSINSPLLSLFQQAKTFPLRWDFSFLVDIV